ncbi:MAG TPA: non-homologous end-joining DNA ligase [Candidatus Nanoarchaeia archaeon]|nr:non-homologous end-joining DNA ligase [Candidatus Nanoarchaeia archaeon]
MALLEYAKKRDFARTPEPRSIIKKKDVNSFVIQRHNARRLHYDLRLEYQGVLKSWAIPKGLPYYTEEVRLAVQTEDHPVEYLNFEGRIPAGNYGAGTVDIWDSGRYTNLSIKDKEAVPLPQAMEKGHIHFFLKGNRVEAELHLIRTKGKNWIVKRAKSYMKEYENKGISNADGRQVSLTNQNKKIYSDIKKGDYIQYYEDASNLILRHITDRPLSLYRFPNGVEGAKFFQKNMGGSVPDWIKTVMIESERRKTEYMIITHKASLIYFANMVAEPHITTSKHDKPLVPDKIVFDLDPGDVPVEKLKETALKLRKILSDIGLKPYIMTTGGKGYHISVPIKREYTSDKVKDFALKVADSLVLSDPNFYTTSLLKTKRKNKIFIDVNRNSAMQTSVCPYGARAKPRLTIAAPFEWDDLTIVFPDSFNIENYPKKDAWRDFFDNARSLKNVINNLTDY